MASAEFDFIDWLRTQERPSALVPLPIGDDLAILKWPADELLLIGNDQVLDGVHFDSRVHSPRQIGRKVMNRNLSDCAAMACLPVAAIAAVALPRGLGIDYLKELYLGLREAADPFDCPLIGGDTASWPGSLAMTVSILGRSAGIQPIARSGAKPGNWIFVSGALGGSILYRHMSFAPRIALARELAKTGRLTAMIDLSDGLSRDLRHICTQSAVGAIIDAAAIPIHGDAQTLSSRDGRPALEHALHDGEDYELLFAASADSFPGCTRIGQITNERGIFLRRDGRLDPLEPHGWEHSL